MAGDPLQSAAKGRRCTLAYKLKVIHILRAIIGSLLRLWREDIVYLCLNIFRARKLRTRLLYDHWSILEKSPSLEVRISLPQGERLCVSSAANIDEQNGQASCVLGEALYQVQGVEKQWSSFALNRHVRLRKL